MSIREGVSETQQWGGQFVAGYFIDVCCSSTVCLALVRLFVGHSCMGHPPSFITHDFR